MLIVDAQVHLWGPNTPERPWVPGRENTAQKPYPVTKDMILAGMDEAGVDRVILVPPSWEGDRNDLALEATKAHPSRFAAMGRFPIEEPQRRLELKTWKGQPGMLGIRLTFHNRPHRDWLTDGTADWFWKAAEEDGIPLMVFVPRSVPAIDSIAERHPRLRFVIDHLALSTAQDDEAFAGLPDVLKLARLPNVAVKASALPLYSSEPYPFANIHKYIRQVYDAFGPRRMFWGTDWTRLPCTWREAITMFTEELPWLSADDREWIMGRGICEWLGWRLPESAA
jgi:predicted TIM-barrel fold metal-dependent hydrolase